MNIHAIFEVWILLTVNRNCLFRDVIDLMFRILTKFDSHCLQILNFEFLTVVSFYDVMLRDTKKIRNNVSKLKEPRFDKWNNINVWKDDNFDDIIKHWVNIFFFDFDTISSVLKKRCELFDEKIVSKIMTNSNFWFDVAIKILNFCEVCKANVSMTIDFFSISHIDLIVSIERNEMLIDFLHVVRARVRETFFEVENFIASHTNHFR